MQTFFAFIASMVTFAVMVLLMFWMYHWSWHIPTDFQRVVWAAVLISFPMIAFVTVRTWE